jgi:hypothetical protein
VQVVKQVAVPLDDCHLCAINLLSACAHPFFSCSSKAPVVELTKAQELLAQQVNTAKILMAFS